MGIEGKTGVAGRSTFRLLPLPRFGALARAGRTELVAAGGRAVATADSRPRRSAVPGAGGLLLGFALCVLLPTGLAGAYWGTVASDIFVSESKFAVRGAVEHLPKSAALDMSTPLTALNSSQDAFVVQAYLESAPLIRKIDKDLDLRAMFRRPEADTLARLKADASAEELRRYWNTMVRTTIDNLSGVLTLKVTAFTRPDALALSTALLTEAEALVNRMSDRRNEDAVRFAREEVDRGERRLGEARLSLQEFRNQSGVLDPVKQAEATLRLVTLLRQEKITLDNELAAARRTLTDAAPSVQVLSARQRSLDDQVKTIEATLTGDTGGGQTASGVLFRFEGLELERQFAERVYLMAQTTYERIRINAERQRLYFVTFVPPSLAEIPLLPSRGVNTLLTFVVAIALWSIMALSVAAVKDHQV